MHTSEEVYHRVRWDPRLDPARFVLGVARRGTTPKRIPLPSFVPGGEIPWHRIVFIEADGELVWDRATGVDRVGASAAGRVRDPRILRAPYFTARTPFAWDPDAAAWRPAPADEHTPSEDVSRPVVRVLTWNTLWDRYDSDRIHSDRRRPLLLAALEAENADVIALQEVEPALLARLLHAAWVRDAYTLHTDPASDDIADHGLVLLCRLPVREAAVHVLGPHKAVVAATVRTASGPLVVANTHLTSDHTEGGPDRRDAELADLAEGLATVDGDLVLVGDFNTGDDAADGGPAAVLGMRDTWTDVHGPHDRTPTFDPAANPLAAISSLSGRASRLDRVLLRTAGRSVSEPTTAPAGAGGVSAGAGGAEEAAEPHPTAAVLLGDEPVSDDGLYVSDHFGVRVDFTLGGGTAGDVLACAPTARTAVAWLPPRELWPVIQEIRRTHDPAFDRWPPHVNVLFGFVPEHEFDRAERLIAAAVAEVTPFDAELAGVETFGHRSDATVWLDPAAGGGEAWDALRHGLARRFPGCRGGAEGYTPHLTLGRGADARQVAADSAARLARAGRMTARVGELALLSRRGDEPMCVRAVFALGTGEVRRMAEPSAAPDRDNGDLDRAAATVGRIVDGVASALPGGVVHVVGSRRMGCALPGADLDLVAAVPHLGAVEETTDTTTTVGDAAAPPLGDTRARILAALPGVEEMRDVVGARVPGLRFVVGGVRVDLTVVDTHGVPPAQAVARRTEAGDAAALALSAVDDADAILAATTGHPEFPGLARRVKAWARTRGLDAAPFGGLPGLAWAVLAARTAAENAGLAGDDLLREFFATWAAWDWSVPITLTADAPEATNSPAAPGLPRPASPVTVLTPTAPVRNCAEQVGPGGRDLLSHEFYRAWEILDEAADSGTDPLAELLAPPDLHRRHAAWAVVTVHPGTDGPGAEERLGATMGRVRGRMRALLTALEDAGAADAHAWPRPFRTGPGSVGGTRPPARLCYAIGLGRTPPAPEQVARIAESWTAGLTGVTVAHARNGDVPTLR